LEPAKDVHPRCKLIIKANTENIFATSTIES
jgi:hypothetical protein